MTFLDMIETYNLLKGNDLDKIDSMYEDIELDGRLDKEVLVGCLLDECGAMRCLYETTVTFKYFSDNFFKKYKWNIKRLLDTLDLEYNPIVNSTKNWAETSDIHQNLDTTEGVEDERITNNTGTQKNEYSNDEDNTISAMNSDNYEPDNKTEGSGENTRTDDLQEREVGSKDRIKNDELTWEEEDTHTESGVQGTSIQDLIERERKVAQFSIYGWIAKKYAEELFLLVY